ncbi:MAG: pur operon repressor, partial [Anaerovoracaceae bacterium]
MKRSHRVGAICQLLTESPHKVFNLKYFCDKFSAAKSSISEDISAVAAAVRANGLGY